MDFFRRIILSHARLPVPTRPRASVFGVPVISERHTCPGRQCRGNYAAINAIYYPNQNLTIGKSIDKQKLLRALEAAIQGLEALARSIKDNNWPKINTELWNARRNLLTLNMMIKRERAN